VPREYEPLPAYNHQPVVGDESSSNYQAPPPPAAQQQYAPPPPDGLPPSYSA
jgi:hypothetical protein